MNVWGIIFSFGVPVCIIAALIAVSARESIAEKRKAKERDRRWHRPVREWWELEVK